MDKPHHRTIQSFVRREGRITRGQQRALDDLGPVYCLSEQQTLDIDRTFGRHARVSLEIGFGNGDALAEMAAAQPDWDFIGIEVHRPGVGRLLQQLDEHELKNVRIYQSDAVKVLQDCIADNSLDRVLLFFPDPWHKKRHHKRRIVQPAFIELLSRKLKPGGILHMATDWEDYAVHMLETLQASGSFSNSAGKDRFSEKPAYRPVTKFEQRGQRLGHGVWDLVFECIKKQGR